MIKNRILYINLTLNIKSLWLNATLWSFMEFTNAIALLTPRTVLVVFVSIAQVNSVSLNASTIWQQEKWRISSLVL